MDDTTKVFVPHDGMDGQSTSAARPSVVSPSLWKRLRKRLTVQSSEWVVVDRHNSGFYEISEVNFKPTVSMEDLEVELRGTRQGSIEKYFTTPVDIFVSSVTSRRFPRWLVWLFPFLRLWPPPLEQRLAKYDAERFGEIEKPFRELIDKTVEVFLCNMLKNSIEKRRRQFFAILVNAVLSVAAVDWLFVRYPTPLSWVLAPVGIVLLSWQVVLRVYKKKSGERFDLYQYALRSSVDNASRPIMERMYSLGGSIEQYVSRIDGLRTEGEKVSDLDKKQDPDLKDGQAFLWMQMMLWLGIRDLGLETHLRNKMETAEKIQTIYDAFGYVMATFVFLCALVPESVFAYGYFMEALSLSPHLHDVRALMGLLPVISKFMIMVAAILFAARISRLSYINWSSTRHILEKYFQTEKWTTFSKLNLDVRLAARVQKAVAEIKVLKDKLGPH